MHTFLVKESNPVLCDLRVLTGGIILLDQGSEDSSLGTDAYFSGEDVSAVKMKPNGMFALGVLLLRLTRQKRHIFKGAKTKLPYAGYPFITTSTNFSPLNSQLKTQSFFFQCDYSVTDLADRCLDYDEKCLTISEVNQKLENLLLFSLPVRKCTGKVTLGAHTLVYFTYSDLCELTDNFSVDNLFAITDFGEAYRGRIQQGWKEIGSQDIVVKMWGQVNFGNLVYASKNSSLEDNMCRLRDEVFLLTQRWMIDNPNVVNLLGYCFDNKKVGAVYSVQPLYTLESLFDDDWFQWKDRIVAILELARTLVLLHRKEQQYVLCSTSPAHIMIDQDKTLILYDFSMLHGQALTGLRAARNSRVMSLVNYRDPYLMQSDSPVTQSDIYAFGISPLTLICKRDMHPVIRNSVFEHYEDRYKSKSSFVHESFASHPFFDHSDGHKLTALAKDCLEQEYVLRRPTACDIVQQLQSLSLFLTDIKIQDQGNRLMC